jgi:hypothetical protein
MTGAGGRAGYNARNPSMSPDFLRGRSLSVALAMFLFVPLLVAADWQTPEQQLAKEITAVTGPGTVALQLDNHSSITPEEVNQIRNRLTSELMYAGVQLASADQAVASVKVTLSENLQNYVWVAEIHGAANDSKIVMVSVPRPADAPAVVPSSTLLTIQKTLLWSEPKRILDVALVSGVPQRMIVLDESSVSIYTLEDGRWQNAQSLEITHSRPWPRDLRGRLMLANDHLFDAYLPGVFCRSSGSMPFAMSCNASDDPWPLGTGPFQLSAFFTANRNYFTGALSPGIGSQKAVTAFYSAAPEPRDKYVLWVLAGVDGQVHLLDGMNDQSFRNLGWGSSLAGVRSSCGSGRQILASSNSSEASDSIKAFEIADRDPVAVSEPLEFDGVITALWTQADGSGAVAVLKDARKGAYEAYQLTIACGQ